MQIIKHVGYIHTNTTLVQIRCVCAWATNRPRIERNKHGHIKQYKKLNLLNDVRSECFYDCRRCWYDCLERATSSSTLLCFILAYGSTRPMCENNVSYNRILDYSYECHVYNREHGTVFVLRIYTDITPIESWQCHHNWNCPNHFPMKSEQGKKKKIATKDNNPKNDVKWQPDARLWQRLKKNNWATHRRQVLSTLSGKQLAELLQQSCSSSLAVRRPTAHIVAGPTCNIPLSKWVTGYLPSSLGETRPRPQIAHRVYRACNVMLTATKNK